jgi:hypothetical protein
VSWRTTGILFVVALLLGGLVWWSNRHQEARKEAEDHAKKLFGEMKAEDVQWIALRTSDGKDARLERKDGAWRVVAPVDFPADATTADGIASALAGLTSEAVIDDARDFSVYGLDQQERVVRFGVAGGERELRVGKKTPIGANNYAATGPSGSVYTIASFRASSLEKPLDDLRERRPLRFDRDAIARIEATWRDGGVVLEKKDGKWALVAPIDADADAETIETLLSDLVFLRADAFIDAPPPDAEVGLDAPQYHVVLVDAREEGKEPLRHELRIGDVLASGKRAVRGSERALYEIPNDRFEKLPKTLVAFRWKELARFVATDAQRFEIAYADPNAESSSHAVTVEGQTSDAEGWTTKPDPMGPGLASRMIAELARLRAEDIAAEKMGPDELAGVGLSPARATLRVFGKAEGEGAAPELAHVLFGIAKNGRVFAKVPSRDTVYLLPDSIGEHVPLTLEAWRNRFVSKEPPQPEPPAAGADAPPPVPDEPADGGTAPGGEEP